MGRLLAQETNVSDLLQFLSDRDPGPWKDLVGFVPDEVAREARGANNADLLLTSGTRAAVIEVKLGHLMSEKQQEKYEALPSDMALFLAGLRSDEGRLEPDSDRWSFLSLSELIRRWEKVHDELPHPGVVHLPATSRASGSGHPVRPPACGYHRRLRHSRLRGTA